MPGTTAVLTPTPGIALSVYLAAANRILDNHPLRRRARSRDGLGVDTEENSITVTLPTAREIRNIIKYIYYINTWDIRLLAVTTSPPLVGYQTRFWYDAQMQAFLSLLHHPRYKGRARTFTKETDFIYHHEPISPHNDIPYTHKTTINPSLFQQSYCQSHPPQL